MDSITNYLNVRDAIKVGQERGTKIGYDHTYENTGDEYDEGEDINCECLDTFETRTGPTCLHEHTYEKLILHELQYLVKNANNTQYYSIGENCFNDFSVCWAEIKIKVGSQDCNITQLNIDTLFIEGTPAPFGDLNTMETVYNPEVRTALELPFELSNGNKYTLRQISHEIQEKLNNGGEVELVPHKANIYSKGSFFKPHVDTPIAKNMLGTLVIMIPSKYEGGNLIVEHGSDKTVYDYSQLKKNRIGWAAFYGNCVHEVTPIISGARVSFTFYIMNKKDEPVNMNLSERFQNHMGKMVKCIQQYKSLGKNTLGIFAQHRYPMNGAKQLKGIDESIHDYLLCIDPKEELKQYLHTDVANIVREYCLKINIEIYPVLVYYDRVADDNYREGNEKTAKVYACTEEDFNYIQGMTSTKPDHKLPDDIPFVGKLLSGRELQSREQSYVEHTGNESQPYSYNGIYLSVVMVLKF